MGETVISGKPRANALSGSSVRSTGFFAKLKLPGVPRYVLPGWENDAFDTAAVAAEELVYTPILVSETTTYTRIWIRTVGPSVAGLCRMGVYRFRDGAPGALVLDAGTVSTTPPGVKEVAISLTLQPGYYFLARVCDAAPNLRCVKRLSPYTYPLTTFSQAPGSAASQDAPGRGGAGCPGSRRPGEPGHDAQRHPGHPAGVRGPEGELRRCRSTSRPTSARRTVPRSAPG